MRYIAIIYMVAICAYNLLGTEIIANDFYNEINISLSGRYWSFHYSFFLYFALTSAFIHIRKKSLSKKDKKIFLVATIFSVLYLIYQVPLFFIEKLSIYLYTINSEFWSITSAIIIIILLIIMLNDKTRGG